jgi:hypothetical protein
MRDWTAIAKAIELRASPAELERITAALSGLETTFRPLVDTLTHDEEPATVFPADEAES